MHCTVEGCTLKITARGLCSRHYQHKRKADLIASGIRCSVEGCENSPLFRGLCQHHYTLERLNDPVNREKARQSNAKQNAKAAKIRATKRVEFRSTFTASKSEIRRHLSHGRSVSDIAVRMGILVSVADRMVKECSNPSL